MIAGRRSRIGRYAGSRCGPRIPGSDHSSEVCPWHADESLNPWPLSRGRDRRDQNRQSRQDVSGPER